jgi:apolipoprotein N-acyltransferase
MNKMLVQYLLCFVGGTFFALGFPSFVAESLLITPLIGVFFLFYFWDKNADNWKRRGLLKLSFSLGVNLMGYYWIPKTLQVFGEMPFFLALLLGTTFTIIIIPQFWAYLLTTRLIFKFIERMQSKHHLPEFKIITLALWMALLEYFIPQQFPTHLGHPWAVLGSNLGLASWFGVPGFSFISYCLIFSTIFFIKKRKIPFATVSVIIAFIILNPLLGIPEIKETNPLAIRVSQANIGNYLKIDSEKGELNSVEKVLDFFTELSTRPYQVNEVTQPDLIVWSETSYPYSINSTVLKKKKQFVPEIFQYITTETGAEFLTGGYDQLSFKKGWFERDYNAAFLFGKTANLKDVYHKMRLIPFGETLPFGPLNEVLSGVFQNIAFFSQGKNYTHFKTEKGHWFITPICYELLYSDFIRDYLNASNVDADLIINLTNDSWYEEPEPSQHLFLTKWRALEFNIPIVRSTNTGYTSVIYPDGSESKRLGRGERNNLDLVIDVPKRKNTIYQRLGVSSTLLLGLLTMFLSFIFYWKRSPLSKYHEA